MNKELALLAATVCLLCGCSGYEDSEPREEAKILVLMYHRITAGESTNLYERSIKDLEADLKYIVEKRINVISFYDLENFLNNGIMPVSNSVVITFDDGDNSWFTLVKPLLIKYKMKATFFLWTNMIGRDSFLTWNEVETMSHYFNDSGERPFTFGSHTNSHVYLSQPKTRYSSMEEYNAFLDYELGESRKLIGSHTPENVSMLSLPFGDGAEDPIIIAAAKRNGYRLIRTSTWSAVNNKTDLYSIPCIPVLDNTASDLIGFYLGLQD